MLKSRKDVLFFHSTHLDVRPALQGTSPAVLRLFFVFFFLFYSSLPQHFSKDSLRCAYRYPVPLPFCSVMLCIEPLAEEKCNSTALHSTFTMHVVKDTRQLLAMTGIRTVRRRSKARLASFRNAQYSTPLSLPYRICSLFGSNRTYLKTPLYTGCQMRCHHPASCFCLQY